METIPIRAGVDLPLTVEIRDALGQPVTAYTGAESLGLILWAGDDRANLVSASTVAWNTPAAGTVDVTLRGSDTATLEPGRYRLSATIVDGGLTLEIWQATLALSASPGSAVAGAVYCTTADLERFGPWVSDLYSDTDQAGFREARVEARNWIDELILSLWQPADVSIAQLDRGLAYSAYAGWGRTLGPSDWLRGQLGEDRLILRPPVVALAAHRSLYLIASARLDTTEGDAYQRRARRHKAEANSLAACTRFEIDTATPKNGRAGLVVHGGSFNLGG